MSLLGKEKVIVVSNPGKQYTHQLLFALQKYNYVFKFYTSFWYKPENYLFKMLSILPFKVKTKLEREFKKRYFAPIDGRAVFQFPYFELIREITDKIFGQRYAEKMQFYRDRFHDKWVSRKLDSSIGVVIGYEETCLHTFRKAKKKNITTILDLAQVHYKEIQSLASEFTSFGDLYRDQKLRKRIDEIKEEELSLADYIICLSEYAKNTLVKNGVPSEKVFVVNLGFDPMKFKAKEEYISKGKLKLIFVGSLTKRKGIDTLLQAHQHLREKVELMLVGPMADAEDLLKRHTYDISVESFVEHEQLNELLRQSDLFVFPSYLDSWAMVVVEAMACGLPVIVSENTGAKEAVVNDSGVVVPPGDFFRIVEVVERLYVSRNELERMGKNARKVSQEYTWDNYHKSIDKVIQRCTN